MDFYDLDSCNKLMKNYCSTVENMIYLVNKNWTQTDFDNVDQREKYDEIVTTMIARLTELKGNLEDYRFE